MPLIDLHLLDTGATTLTKPETVLCYSNSTFGDGRACKIFHALFVCAFLLDKSISWPRMVLYADCSNLHNLGGEGMGDCLVVNGSSMVFRSPEDRPGHSQGNEL